MKRFAIPFVLLVLYFSCGNKRTQDSTGVLHPVMTHEVLHYASGAVVWDGGDNNLPLIIGTDNDAEGALYAYNLKGDIVKKSVPLAFPQHPVVAEDIMVNGCIADAVITVEAQSGKVRVLRLPDLEPLDNGGIEVLGDEKEAVAGSVSVWTRPADKAIFVTIARTLAGKDCLWQYRLLANSRGVSLSFVRKFGMADGSVQSIVVNHESGYLYCSDALGIKQFAVDPALSRNDALSETECGVKNNLVIYSSGSKASLLASDEKGMAVLHLSDDGSIAYVNAVDQKFAITASSNIAVDGFAKGIVVGLNDGLNFCCYKKQDIDKYIKF